MILLDTHVVVWWQAGGQRLSATAARAIASADVVLVSPISCWELGMLVEKQRVRLDRDVASWIRALYEGERVDVAALSPEAAVVAASLGATGFHGDSADRMLYATALDLRVAFVTKDERIHAHATGAVDVQTIW